MSENAWSDDPSASSGEKNSNAPVNYDAKIFVGGLEWSTTADDLRTYFEKFGTVVDSEVKTDHHTGHSRGFAFVTFADSASVEAVVSLREHFIAGRKIDPKKIKFRDTLKPIHKIFVGGVDSSISEAAIREYFCQFGTIDEIDLPYDHQKQERRHFCFVRFTSNDPVERLCRQPFHTISGQTVEIKKMMSKTEKNMLPSEMPMNNYGSSYDFGHRGRGRGAPSYAMPSYSASYVDSRQASWPHGVAEYGARDPMVSPMLGYSRVSAALSPYESSFSSVGQSLLPESASFRSGRHPTLSAARVSAAYGTGRQPLASGYDVYGETRQVYGETRQVYGETRQLAGIPQDYGDRGTNGDSVGWTLPVGYQPRYSSTAMSQDSYIQASAASSGMTRGQRYQPYSR